MKNIILGLVLAAIPFAVLASETVTVGNLKITCPNACVVTRQGDNVSIVDSLGGELEIEFLDQEGPLEP